MQPLLYGEKPMKSEPINIGLREAAEIFSLLGRPITVVLEPGDGTRYELLLVPNTKHAKLQNWSREDFVVTVVRCIGGDPIEADAYRFSTFDYFDMKNIGRSNQWTKQFVCWWLKSFREVCTQVKQQPSASANTALSDPRTPYEVQGTETGRTNIVKDLEEGESITP